MITHNKFKIFKMTIQDLPENIKTRLCCHLNYLVSIKSTSTYGKVADHCEIPPPRKIRKLNELLLSITKDDIINNKPLRAAVVVSKVEKHSNIAIPFEDFFDLVYANMLCNKKNNKNSNIKFHKDILENLFK